MRALFSLVASAALCFAALPAKAGAPAFIEATSELDGGKPATSMWNAVDNNVGTIWCSEKQVSGKQAINFTFEESVSVTHIGLLFPRGKDGGVDRANKRPKIVSVADVGHRVEAKFKDSLEMQILELTPPTKGRRIVVEFDEFWAGATDDAPLCVAEIVLKSKTRELTGEIAQKVRGINTSGRRLLHQWHDDLSAPTSSLLFSMDGTFTYGFTPLMDDQKPLKLKGRWSAGGNTLTLEVKGKSFSLETRLTMVDDAGAKYPELSLAGVAPHPSMIATFKPAPLLLP